MACADSVTGAKTADDYKKWESEQPEDKLRTMGRFQYTPFGLYECRAFVSANLAAQTGFDDEDLRILLESILNMYEHDRSASKGMMSVITPLIIFRHVGVPTDGIQRDNRKRLGCAPAHRLFDLIKVERKSGIEVPRSWKDYSASIDMEHCPAGVDIGFLTSPYGEVTWNKIPEDAELFQR